MICLPKPYNSTTQYSLFYNINRIPFQECNQIKLEILNSFVLFYQLMEQLNLIRYYLQRAEMNQVVTMQIRHVFKI